MESKYGGYMGRVVMYDLSTQTLTEYPWSDEERALYIGGKTMATRIMLDNFTGKEQAFSKENLIIISTGPLTGTGAPAGSAGADFPHREAGRSVRSRSRRRSPR